MLAQGIRFREGFVGTLGLASVGIHLPEVEVAAGKIRVDFDSVLEEGQCRGSSFFVQGYAPKTCGLQSLQGRCRCLRERDVEFLHIAQRFTKFATQLARCLAQPIENLFLGCGGNLLLCEGISVLAIYSFQAEEVLAANACDGASDPSLAVCALADFLSDFRRKARVGGPRHESQRLTDPVVRENIQEW